MVFVGEAGSHGIKRVLMSFVMYLKLMSGSIHYIIVTFLLLIDLGDVRFGQCWRVHEIVGVSPVLLGVHRLGLAIPSLC